MVDRGDAFLVDEGTHAKVTALRDGVCEVTILEGKAKSRTGLISPEWATPEASPARPLTAAEKKRNKADILRAAAFLRSEEPALAKLRKERDDSVAKEIANKKAAADAEQARKAELKKKEDAESAAAGKLTLAKSLLADPATAARGRQRLAEIVRDYPGTKGAAEAKEMMEARP
jgi:hypothetical protein